MAITINLAFTSVRPGSPQLIEGDTSHAVEFGDHIYVGMLRDNAGFGRGYEVKTFDKNTFVPTSGSTQLISSGGLTNQSKFLIIGNRIFLLRSFDNGLAGNGLLILELFLQLPGGSININVIDQISNGTQLLWEGLIDGTNYLIMYDPVANTSWLYSFDGASLTLVTTWLNTRAEQLTKNTNDSNLYAWFDGAFARSTDGGSNWTTTVSPNNFFTSSIIGDLRLQFSNPGNRGSGIELDIYRSVVDGNQSYSVVSDDARSVQNSGASIKPDYTIFGGLSFRNGGLAFNDTENFYFISRGTENPNSDDEKIYSVDPDIGIISPSTSLNEEFSFSAGDRHSIWSARGLAGGGHTLITVTNPASPNEVRVYKITDSETPVEPEDVGGFISIPTQQSLQIYEQVNIDYCNIFPTLDNQPYCEQGTSHFKNPPYYQDYQKCDRPPVQIQAQFDDFEVSLKSEVDDSVIFTYDPIKTAELQSQELSFTVRLENNGGGQTRIYFPGYTEIPIPLVTGDQFEITNNADGLDGIYEVINVVNDALLGTQYLVITLTYTAPNPTSSAVATFINNVVQFDIYEFTLIFDTLAVGRYYLEIIYQPNTDFTRTFRSEPIRIFNNGDLKDYLYFRWTNEDRANDIDYSNSINHIVRVEGFIFDRFLSGLNETLTQTDGEVVQLAFKPQRGVLARVYRIPPYLIEKLSLAVRSDFVFINEVRYKTQDGFGDPNYRVRFGLNNIEGIFIQSEWFDSYNGDDLAGEPGVSGGFVVANEGFIKRR